MRENPWKMKKNFALGKSVERMALSEKKRDKNIDEKIVEDKNDVKQKFKTLSSALNLHC